MNSTSNYTLSIINNLQTTTSFNAFIEVLTEMGDKVYKPINITLVNSDDSAPYFEKPLSDIYMKVNETEEALLVGSSIFCLIVISLCLRRWVKNTLVFL